VATGVAGAEAVAWPKIFDMRFEKRPIAWMRLPATDGRGSFFFASG
jgi:hypothetical protein